MEKHEIDLLEEYIATGNKNVRDNTQLTDLCDLVDEIRALHPPLPAPDFQERTVRNIAEKIASHQPRRRFYALWFKSAGWASAAVAAVLLVSMGVLPHKPSEYLPPVPAAPVQETAPSSEENAPPLIHSSDTVDQRQTIVNSDPKKKINQPESVSNGVMPALPPPAIVNSDPKKEINQPESVSNGVMPALSPPANVSMGQSLAVKEYAGKAEKKKTAGEAGLAAERVKAVPLVLADDSAVNIQGEVPFKVLTLPDRSPVQVKINEDPPGVTMTYIIGQDEIVVRQWMEEATDTAKVIQISQTAPELARAVRVLHDDVIVEVSGNADRKVLEEYAHSLR